MKLQDVLDKDLKLGLEVIAGDKELATQVQTRLIALGILDPPADGAFGPISSKSLKEFQDLLKCGEANFLGPVTAKKLIETKELPKPELKLGNDLASSIIKYLQAQQYQIFQGEKQYNIVYVEGLDPSATLNNDAPNAFNDLRTVIEIIQGVPKIVGRWQATTEPGRYYTYNPMNQGGAARIKFGQYKSWQVGWHGNAERHEALVQVANVTVFRDFNQDFMRTGDKTDTGLFGINQHWGYDLDYNNVHNASAGCLVGRTRDGHREFMAIIKKDKRYVTNYEYVFYTTVIPGDELVAKFPPQKP